MKTKWITVVLLLSLALNLGVAFTVGFHWARHRVCGPRPGIMHRAKFQKMLGLSKDQTALMEQRRRQLDNDIQPLRERLQEKKKAMLALLDAGDTYTPQMDALIGEIGGLQMEIEKRFLRHSIEVKQNLTPEQRKKFTAILEKGFLRSHSGPGGSRRPD